MQQCMVCAVERAKRLTVLYSCPCSSTAVLAVAVAIIVADAAEADVEEREV